MVALLICRVNDVSCKPKKYLDAAFESLYESEQKLKVFMFNSTQFLGSSFAIADYIIILLLDFIR